MLERTEESTTFDRHSYEKFGVIATLTEACGEASLPSFIVIQKLKSFRTY